ncbi:hypothetical protein F5884DRAFT_883775 [Xylogone sp. PMI_703]|nr:hypothetical protein F5884DRAFT_883775 [Xylogone sp. PMI_703]
MLNLRLKNARSLANGTFTLAGQEYDAVDWWQDSGMRSVYMLLLIPLVTSMTNGYDGSMMNALQTSDQWQDYFNHPRGSILAVFNLIFAIGQLAAILSFPVGAYIADHWGRRGGVMVGSIISTIDCALQTASINFPMFLVALMIDHASAPLLVNELCHTQHRARVTAVYNTTWYFGSIIEAWATFGTINIQNSWSWRIPSLLQGVPAVFQICFVWFVPESPRFLIDKERHEEALKILVVSWRWRRDRVMSEYLEIKETLALEKEYWSKGFFSQWSGNGLVSYYLVPVLETIGITGSSEQAGLNGGLQIWNFIVALWAAFNIDPLYNKTPSAGDGKDVIAMIFFYYTAFNCGWQGLVLAYPVEILPYNIRAEGLTVTFLVVSTSILNQYINLVGHQNIGCKFYILIVVSFLWVETKNTPLEEACKVFDGEDAHVGGLAATKADAAVLEQIETRETTS